MSNVKKLLEEIAGLAQDDSDDICELGWSLSEILEKAMLAIKKIEKCANVLADDGDGGRTLHDDVRDNQDFLNARDQDTPIVADANPDCRGGVKP